MKEFHPILLQLLEDERHDHGKSKDRLDQYPEVYVNGAPVLSLALAPWPWPWSFDQCRMFPSYIVDDPSSPHVEVCGTGIKATFFFKPGCHYREQFFKTLESCGNGKASDPCVTWSPTDDPTRMFGHYQSYKIEQC